MVIKYTGGALGSGGIGNDITRFQLAALTSASSSRTTAWDGTVTHTVTITAADWITLTEFFKSGGQVRFAPYSLGGGTSGTPGTFDYYYNILLNNIGDIIYTNYGVTANGSAPGTLYAVTPYNLTATDQLMWRKVMTDGGPYTPYGTENVEMFARLNGTPGLSTTNQITFTLNFNSDVTVNPVTLGVACDVSWRYDIDLPSLAAVAKTGDLND